MKLSEIGALAYVLTGSGNAGVAKLADACLSLLKIVDATVTTGPSGPCYRTSNGVPMQMPREVERQVRAALASLEAL